MGGEGSEPKPRRQPPEGARVTYYEQRRMCGKTNCSCHDNGGHGPYWYAYWVEDKRVRSAYIGKRMPEAAK